MMSRAVLCSVLIILHIFIKTSRGCWDHGVELSCHSVFRQDVSTDQTRDQVERERERERETNNLCSGGAYPVRTLTLRTAGAMRRPISPNIY